MKRGIVTSALVLPVLAAVMLPAAGIRPATAAELSLSEAMATARGQAREVMAAQARATAAATQHKVAKAYRLPKISIQEVWMRTNSPAGAFALQLNQQRFSFPDFVMGDPNNPDPITNALTRFELMLPIYTGGEIGGRVDQADLAAESAGQTVAWTADGAALAAAEAYIMLAQARENVTLLERSLETIAAHVDLAKAYVDQGMLVRSELLRAEVEQARIQNLLSEARGQAAVAEANLSFRLAAEAESSWELRPMVDPLPLAGDLDSWLATAHSRQDLEAARKLLAAGQLEGRIRKSGLFPKLGMTAQYDLNDDRPFGAHGQNWSVMAMAKIDLFGGGDDRAAAAVAEAEAEAAAYDIERFSEGVRLEVKGAWERAVTSRDRFGTASAAVAAALEAERITEERFKKGVVKMIELLDISTARQEAETRELVARADAHLSTLQLAVKSGRQPESVLP